MPKSDPFTLSLRADLKGNKLTLQKAAVKAKKSFRQFTRELRGETSQGMMSIETLAELKHEGAISNSTVETWWQVKKHTLHLKKESPAEPDQRKIS